MSWPEEEEVAHNQLALRADDDAPLLSPTQALSRRVSAGTTRRRGCGVCRACLFMPHRKVCLATKAASDVAASEEGARKSRRKRASAHKLERRLEKRRRQAETPATQPHEPAAAPVTAATAQQQQQLVCRLCKGAEHRAPACPLLRHLGAELPNGAGRSSAHATAADEDDVTTWTASLDAPTRAVLLCVQQLASARLGARATRLKANQLRSLTPAQLRPFELVLLELRDSAPGKAS